jgi:hypothetical protein
MTQENQVGSSSDAPVLPAPSMCEDQVKQPQVTTDGLPWVELPRVGRILSEFAADVGAVMATNGVYLQDGEPVVLQPRTDRMEPLTPACFRTYAEKIFER